MGFNDADSDEPVVTIIVAIKAIEEAMASMMPTLTSRL